MTPAEEFTEFATGAAARLRRTAFLLCGDWHTAEDFTQTTLAKMFVSWRRISRRDAVYAYANRTLVNTYLADRRRRRSRKLLTGWLPDAAAEPGTPELRMVVLDALATLPPKTRVVVVMRYWADLSAYPMGTVVPITTATNRAGKPIPVASGPMVIAITPDGRTAYVSGTLGVTPISVATNTAGPPIRAGTATGSLAITPDGTTVLAGARTTVTPISTATDTAGHPIPGIHSGAGALVIAP